MMDSKALLAENNILKKRLHNYTIIQQKLIDANDKIDRQLEVYKKINRYVKMMVETSSLQDFGNIIAEGFIDVFQFESALVIFEKHDITSVSSEGIDTDKYDINHLYESILKSVSNKNSKKPVYLNQSLIRSNTYLNKFESVLYRKFTSNKDQYNFVIVGLVSKKHAFNYDKLNPEQLILLDNFSGQIHSVFKQRLYGVNLKYQKDKYRSIIANMKLGLLEVDNHDRILMSNPSFSEMSGYQEEELIGKLASDVLLKEEDHKKMKGTIAERSQNISSVYELTVNNKEGDERTWLISGAPNYDIDGNVIGSIGIHLDITNQKKTEQNLNNANKDLKKINHELDTFVYRVSHDLRTPLLSIIGLIDLIKTNTASDIGEQNLEFINLIDQSANRLDNTIQEILNYSRNSRLDLDIHPLNIKTIVHNICKDLKFVNTSIQFDTNFNDIEFINTDKTRIETVLKNLLSNAVKYHSPYVANPVVKFNIEEQGANYIIIISDNGSGIPKESIDKIFNMFFRGTTKSKGTGLGLFIVKEMVEKLNGSIAVESIINIGTKFTIKIPNLKI